MDAIATALRSWSTAGASHCNLIITTGGTGFGARDVTPEATAAVLTKQLPALPLAIMTATTAEEPLSFLSRGVAGVISDRTIVLNVPGAPRAVAQHLRAGLPLLAHAVAAVERKVAK